MQSRKSKLHALVKQRKQSKRALGVNFKGQTTKELEEVDEFTTSKSQVSKLSHNKEHEQGTEPIRFLTR